MRYSVPRHRAQRHRPSTRSRRSSTLRAPKLSCLRTTRHWRRRWTRCALGHTRATRPFYPAARRSRRWRVARRLRADVDRSSSRRMRPGTRSLRLRRCARRACCRRGWACRRTSRRQRRCWVPATRRSSSALPTAGACRRRWHLATLRGGKSCARAPRARCAAAKRRWRGWCPPRTRCCKPPRRQTTSRCHPSRRTCARCTAAARRWPCSGAMRRCATTRRSSRSPTGGTKTAGRRWASWAAPTLRRCRWRWRARERATRRRSGS
mmetsp:Transcript_290/g.776  ORF Transcript_290/g.776 Transcript_290/m.776 type:complete len:265 (-) Transcript_290:1200-1994(-)